MVRTGRCYANGWGCRKDINEAVKYWSAASKRGNVNAMYDLGLYYCKEPLKDYEKAAFWWGKAAQKNHALAQYNLGMMYLNGIAVARNRFKAASLLKKSAAQGNLEAKKLLQTLEPKK